MPRSDLKSTQFRREREAAWRELEALVSRAEKDGVRSLSAHELMRLPVLYRAAMSSLSVARGVSLDRNVLDYLENLCERAYLCVYGTRTGFARTAASFLGARFPAAVRALRWHILLAAVVLAFGTSVGWVLTGVDEARFAAFVDTEIAGGRGPANSAEDLREILYSGGNSEFDELNAFATFLFTHNARIGILAFALGFALGIPTVLLVFNNGLMLGAFAALHQNRGLSVEFWGWVLPHGVTELLAVVLCAGAGLGLAGAVIVPGEHTRMYALSTRGRLAGQVVLGAVVMFFVAGLIEGIFRQAVHDVTLRYALAVGTAVFWSAYFGLAGRAASREVEP